MAFSVSLESQQFWFPSMCFPSLPPPPPPLLGVLEFGAFLISKFQFYEQQWILVLVWPSTEIFLIGGQWRKRCTLPSHYCLMLILPSTPFSWRIRYPDEWYSHNVCLYKKFLQRVVCVLIFLPFTFATVTFLPVPC